MKEKKLSKKIIITIICIVINVIGRFLAEQLSLPIWLDMEGTCIAGFFAGPVCCVITGVANNLIAGISDATALVYVVTSFAISISVNVCVKKGAFDGLTKALIASFWIGVLSVFVSTPLNLIFNDGYSGNMWGDALFDMLKWYGASKLTCAVACETIVEIVDKQICTLLAFLIIQGVVHFHKKRMKNAASRVVSLLLVGMITFTFTMPMVSVYAEEGEDTDNYLGTIYNNRTGMMSSEANVIAETDDGCIWVGSYAGLTRYDGNRFEFVREGGITNVTYMLNDSKGRLWIGTNDSGIARYENGDYTFFNMGNGLPANSIRSFAEGKDGSIYVGTTDKICKFASDDTVTVLDADISYVVSMKCYKDNVICIDNNGNLYVLENDKVKYALMESDTGKFCYDVEVTSKGILVGTADKYLYRLHIEEKDARLSIHKMTSLDNIVGIEEDSQGQIWICAEAGFGYVNENGQFKEQRQEGFDYSFEWIHEDYQGNIWLASSRYGVLKYSQSQISNIFAKADVPSVVVNAVVRYQGDLYCGTDSGLVIIDGNNETSITNALTGMLDGNRIRSLMVDSKNQLWICTYGQNGLVRYNELGETEIFDIASKGATSDRFRCIIETKENVIVAGTSDGINFIKDDRIVGTITGEDGLENTQILSLVEGQDGRIYAGSDGAGIYAIENQKIAKHYSTEDGLTSDVILRMVSYKDGFFVVTSNSLCCMKKDGITALKEFPYFNNYDVIIQDDMAYVPSSAGIYVANVADLGSGNKFTCQLYSSDEGLLEGLTANSWNYADESGDIYLCSNSGVVKLLTDTKEEEVPYKFGLVSVDCDGREMTIEDGVYQLPLDAKLITLQASVKNYALNAVQVRFYVKELNTHPEVIAYQDIEPIQISNLISGEYTICLEILANDGETILQEQQYTISKKTQIWETSWYKVYLAVVCIELIIYTTWTVMIMVNLAKRKGELEKIRKELEAKVDSQMQEIMAQKGKTERMFLSMVVALSEAVDAKDRYTSGHSKRVAAYAEMLAERMGKDKDEQAQIYFAALLHDIGKIRIPEDIINKPGKLTADEYEMIKIHSVTGYHILKGISEDMDIAIGAKYHHERYDGKGYPNGLSGENIPEIARIIGVADAYDAMASSRSYREALPQHEVRSEIEKGRGTQFDPQIAEIMLQIMDEDEEYRMKQTENLKKTILVVEHEEVNVETIKEIMKDEPMYTTVFAGNENEAAKIVESTEVDLILLDLEMPEVDGFKALEEIRKIAQIPVVFMTSNKTIEMIERAEKMGVEDYLTKPFLPLAFKEIIHSALNSL